MLSMDFVIRLQAGSNPMINHLCIAFSCTLRYKQFWITFTALQDFFGVSGIIRIIIISYCLSSRSSSEDGGGQTRLSGFLRETNRAGTAETEHNEGDASSPSSPPTLS